MITSEINPGDYGRIGQYNDLRKDAKKSSWLLAHEQLVPNDTLKIESGYISFGGKFIDFPTTNTSSITAPVTNPRIDLVSIEENIEQEPTSGIIQTSNNSYLDDLGGTTLRGHNKIGQTFTINLDVESKLYYLNSIILRGRRGSTSSYDEHDLCVSVYTDNGSDRPDILIGQSFFKNNIFSSTLGNVSLDVSNAGIILDNEKKYFLQIQNVKQNTNSHIELRYQNTDVYSDGLLCRYDGTSWSDITGDLYFELNINTYEVLPIVNITTGLESINPIEPIIDENTIPVCYIYNRVGQTSIKDTNDSVNGYIYKDIRNNFSEYKNIFYIEYLKIESPYKEIVLLDDIVPFSTAITKTIDISNKKISGHVKAQYVNVTGGSRTVYIKISIGTFETTISTFTISTGTYNFLEIDWDYYNNYGQSFTKIALKYITGAKNEVLSTESKMIENNQHYTDYLNTSGNINNSLETLITGNQVVDVSFAGSNAGDNGTLRLLECYIK